MFRSSLTCTVKAPEEMIRRQRSQPMSHSVLESQLAGGIPEVTFNGDFQVSDAALHIRPGLVASVTSALRSQEHCGALLIGDHGVGKTFIARQAMEELAGQCLMVSLRGSEATSGVAFGALAPLMGAIEDPQLENPLAVLRDIARDLDRRANGRAVIIFLDNVQFLDPDSAMIVGQLVTNRTARLLLACDSLASAPQEIIGLWRDGMLVRVDVPSFSEAETRLWLRALLQTPISEAAAMALWVASRGNPRLLYAVLMEQIEAKILTKSDGVWVLTGAAFACTGNTADTILASVVSLPDEERQVAEVLALSGGMSIDHLMSFCDPVAVDSLQHRGYLTLSHGETGGAQLAGKMLAEVLAEQVTVGRSRELYQLVTRVAGGNGTSSTSRVAMAVWAIDCGHQLDLEPTLAAARIATNIGRPEQAIHILDALHGNADDLRVGLQQARAHMAIGDLSRSKTAINQLKMNLDRATVAQRLELLLLRSRIVSGPAQGTGESNDVLEEITRALDGSVSGRGAEDGEVGRLHEQLKLALAERAMHEGRYLEVESKLKGLYASDATLTTKRMAALWLMEIYTLTGRVTDAEHLATEIDFYDVIGDEPGGTSEPCGSALIGAVTTSLMAAKTGSHKWNESAGMFNRSKETSLEELVYGLNLAYHGCSDKALSALISAASQLDRLGEHGAASLARSARGYVHALKGENDAAQECLRRGRSAMVNSSRLISIANAYFQVMTLAELDLGEKAIVKLFALADEERRFKTVGVELAFVSSAVRLGNMSGAQRLIELADRVQGEQARIFANFGRGLLAQDASTLVAAAESALAQGDHVLARDVSRAALKIARESLDKVHMRMAQQLIRIAVLSLGRVQPSTEDGQVLTLREQEIAIQAADGASNKAIAAKMHISVRTVEGHLYQVYAKLQVTSRAELRETLT